MIATTDDASDRVLQVALPIIPKHIWKARRPTRPSARPSSTRRSSAPGPTRRSIGRPASSSASSAIRTTGARRRFQDEVDLVIYKTADTMVQALKSGELDYAHGINAEQLNAACNPNPNIKTVVGSANGWTQLAFNGYGADTGKTIPNGGPSTTALLDPAFRDALGYAVDHDELVDRVLGGYGDVGTTIVPPVLTQWHVEPTTPRKFDIELAKQKLDATPATSSTPTGRRLDKEEQADHPPADDAGLRRELPQGGAVHRGLVRRARGQGDHPGPELGRPDRDHLSARRPARATRPTTTSSCGAGAAASTRTACSRSSSATRSATRPTASTATRNSTRCTTTSWPPPRPRSARRSSPRCRTSSTTRPSTTSCTTTRTSTAIAPTSSRGS